MHGYVDLRHRGFPAANHYQRLIVFLCDFETRRNPVKVELQHGGRHAG
jgi:hypothetical protein